MDASLEESAGRVEDNASASHIETNNRLPECNLRSGHRLDTHRLIFVKDNKKNIFNEVAELVFAHSKQIEINTLTSIEAIDIEDVDEEVYVLLNFDGDVFQHLQALRARIIGPLVLLANINHGLDLPMSHGVPIYNGAMKNITVMCCSSMDNDLKGRISTQVKYMGGHTVEHMIAGTSHYICFGGESRELATAVDYGLTLATPEWVEQIWRHSKDRLLSADDKIFNRFLCPPFLGRKVSFLGFSSDKLDEVASLVVAFGGTLVEDPNNCSHLVVADPKDIGFNLVDHINVVTESWLKKCIEQHKYLNPRQHSTHTDMNDETLIQSDPMNKLLNK